MVLFGSKASKVKQQIANHETQPYSGSERLTELHQLTANFYFD